MYVCKQFKVVVIGLLALLVASFTCISSAMANNTFANATVISGAGVITDTNTAATGETGEYVGTFPAGSGSPLNSMWYDWTAPSSGVVSFGTCNPNGSTTTNFDTTIVVATGPAVNALTVIAQNDDSTACHSTASPSYASKVTFSATSGTVYHIQIDGYGNSTGTFQLFYGFSGYTTVASSAATAEGGATSSFTVELTAVPSGTATISIGTSPQCTFSPSTLNFTAANWNTPQTVTVAAIDDTAIEGAHLCSPASITPSGGGVAQSSAPPPVFTVTDNDTGVINITNTTNGAEAGLVNGVFTINQSGVIASDNTISYTVAGTAASGTDYTVLSGTVVIPAGQTSATILVPVINDTLTEPSETVIVTMTSDSSSQTTLGTTAATVQITSDDPSTASITRTTNGNEAGPVSAVFTVTLTNPSSTNSVFNLARSGTAVAPGDYTNSPGGTVTIAAGSTTATLTYPVINDATIEGDETLIVTLSGVNSGQATLGSPAAATATLFDNDAPTVTIANAIQGAEAGPTNGTMTLTLSQTRPVAVTVAYTVTGTATSGTDYTALSGSITIPANTLTAPLSIPVLNDTNIDPGETVIVTLTSVTSGTATIGATVTATNTIVDNDVATLSLSKSWSFAAPGNDANSNGTADPGDIVSYSFVVVNTGTLPIADVVINEIAFSGVNGTPVALSEQVINDVAPLNDSTDATSNNGTWSSLAPGDTVRYRATYTVAQADIDNQ
jgi:Calx-beta domain